MHSFDRFHVVTKFILPTIGDLNFSKLKYDDTCMYMDNKNVQNTEARKYMSDLKTLCKKIEPFIVYYCYVRQCMLLFYIVLYFFKCLGFNIHFISLYGALSLHNCSSSGSLVFAHLGGINKITH